MSKKFELTIESEGNFISHLMLTESELTEAIANLKSEHQFGIICELLAIDTDLADKMERWLREK